MTAQYAIHELKQVRQYCSARAIPAIDYAIQVLQGLWPSGSAWWRRRRPKAPRGPLRQTASRIDGIIHHGYRKRPALL